MSIPTPVYNQLLSLLNEHSQYRDLRHLKALAWMINALLCSGTINLSEWEAYVSSRAEQAQSTERTYRAAEVSSAVSSSRRWQRFLKNHRIRVRALYLPLVMAALNNWQRQRLYLALDTTVLWNRFCIIHLSVVCCGRAVPFLWKVLEHKSSSVAEARIQINTEASRATVI